MFLKIKKIAFIISLSAFLAGIIPCMASAGNCFSASNPYYTLGSNSIEINRLTPIEIKELIDEEKNEYINRAPDIFEFDNTLMGKVDHKFLLISLIKLNYLFDKYEDFTTNFINYKRALNTKFRLQFDDHTGNMSSNMFSINFGTSTTNYCRYLHTIKYSTKIGFHPQVDNGHEVEIPITHEFGHLIERLYIIKTNILLPDLIPLKKQCNDINKLENNIYQELRKKPDIKFQIIFMQALEKYSKLQTRITKLYEQAFTNENSWSGIQSEILQGLEGQDRNISRYGCKDALEFFAEAFAHLECTDNPENVNEIGKRIESYIVNQMGYLPKENSKFNK